MLWPTDSFGKVRRVVFISRLGHYKASSTESVESLGGADRPVGGSAATLGSRYRGLGSRESSTGGYQGQLVLAEVIDAVGVGDQFDVGGMNVIVM